MNKNKFKTLGKVLAKAGINIDYQIDWSSSTDGPIKHTDQPRLGSGTYNGIQGWYLLKLIIIIGQLRKRKQLEKY